MRTAVSAATGPLKRWVPRYGSRGVDEEIEVSPPDNTEHLVRTTDRTDPRSDLIVYTESPTVTDRWGKRTRTKCWVSEETPPTTK